MTMSTKEKHTELHKILSQANRMIQNLQHECSHPEGVFEYKSDTGNYSPSNDSWWKEMTCDHCGKWWQIYDHAYGKRNPEYYNNKPNWKEIK